jgi:acetylornithine deacetylase/succinyl-diaminopimelate desuccinylase-like protein
MNGDALPAAAELLSRLIRFDTSNPPGLEAPCVAWVVELLRDAGVEARVIARDERRPNLVARLPGSGAAQPLLLYGHLDVVPATEPGWRHPPFGGDLVDGVVWGRGALDMKAGVAMYLHAFLRIARAGPPPGDVILMLTSDEETGSAFGAAFIVEEHPEIFDGVRHALSELGAVTRWVGGRALYPIQVAEKQACVVRATVRGGSGHGSTVVRDSGPARLGRLLSRFERRHLPVHVTPVARLMLESMGEHLGATQRAALAALLRPVLTDRLLRVLGHAGDALAPLLHNTAAATVLRGGAAVNVIPGVIEVDLDGRVLPGYTPHDLVRELHALAGDLAAFELVREEPAAPAAPDLSLMPTLGDVLRELDSAARPHPMLLPGYTDARHIAKRGIQTYGFTPLKLERRQPSTELLHAVDERVPAAAVEFGAEAVWRVLTRAAVGRQGSRDR